MGERRKLRAADLFCGAGGTSTGAIASGAVDVVLAVNHWLVAVNSHLENHKSTRHVCAEIDMVDPRDFVDMGLDLLLASPECIFHSNARGGKPVDDQRRATAWCVPRWAEVLKPKWIVVENVREFKDWGPLIEKRCRTSGRILKEKGKTAWVPDKTRKGEIFNAWVAALKGIGYHVEYRLLNAADFGAATNRVRLFVIARYGKSTAPIPWPVPTHKPEHYTPAAAVIDWSLPTPSIFTRKRPLSEKTLRRIEIGVRKFAGPDRKPFLVDRNWQENRGGRNRVHSIDDPLTTITTQGGQAIVNLHGKGTAHGIGEALPTVTGTRNLGIADAAFITPNFGEHERQQPRTHSAEELLAEHIQGLRLKFPDSPGMQTLLNTMEELGIVDIGYRMLVNDELKLAQGFPKDYLLFGTQSEVTKQIGNSVHTYVSEAICRALATPRRSRARASA